MNETLFDNKSIRRIFSRIGFSLCVMLVISVVLQLLWVNIPVLFLGTENWFTSSSWGLWIGSFVPLYLIAIPVGLLIIRKLPAETTDGEKFSVRQLLTFIPICMCLMYAGNLVGTILSFVLSKGQAQNSLLNYAMDTNPLKIPVVVIFGPMIEELVFRKIIIDRTRVYGEKTAVIFSAFLFALFHQNLYQFFYAFALGLVFGYVYIRSSRLHYTIILHAIINFLGSVVAPWIIKLSSVADLSKLDDATMQSEQLVQNLLTVLPAYLLLLLYSATLLGMSIWGLVLLIDKGKKARWQEARCQLAKDIVIKTVYINTGMIIFLMLCTASTIFMLFQ